MSFISDIFGGDKPDYSQAEFQPYNITGPAGGVTYEGQTGTVALAPELQQLFQQYLAGATGALPSAEQQAFANQVSQYGQGLFGQAMGLDTQQMTSDYYNQVLAGLNPQREQESVSLANTLFSQGRTGAGAGVTGGYVNPEQFALLKAREAQNQQLYLGAEDRARQIQMDKIKQALGLYGTGQELTAAPYATSANILGYGAGILGMTNPYIAPSIQAGQAAAQAGGNIVAAQQQGYGQNLGFWGSLLGGG
jgi:hypothetical protein